MPDAMPNPPRPSTQARCGSLVDALEAILDEGISDFSSRTAASRRRMAALCFAFVRGEELSVRARAGVCGGADALAFAREIERLLRHLVFWTAGGDASDPSAGSRRALGGLRGTLREVTGSDAGAHDPMLLDCERCGLTGADLVDAPGEGVVGLCSRCAMTARATASGA